MNERTQLEREFRDLAVVHEHSRSGEREVLHSPDQRLQVGNTDAVPFRYVCHLELSARDTSDAKVTAHSIATGILIGPRHVLTTGHTLLAQNGRFQATHAWVSPGRNGRATPFGRVEATRFRTHANWVRNGVQDDNFDYGLITLDDAIGVRRFASLRNASLGCWGDAANGGGTRLTRLDPTILDGQTINVAGYPDDQAAGTLWRSSGQLTMMRDPQGRITTMDRRMAHNADTHSSQSGSPVWLHDPKTGLRHLVGVHEATINVTTQTESGPRQQRLNVAVRVTREMLRQLADWM